MANSGMVNSDGSLRFRVMVNPIQLMVDVIDVSLMRLRMMVNDDG